MWRRSMWVTATYDSKLFGLAMFGGVEAFVRSNTNKSTRASVLLLNLAGNTYQIQ